MKPHIDPGQIDAFVDGELALERRLELEHELQLDAELRERVDAARQLRAAIREHAEYHEMPAALRAKLAATVAPSAPASASETRRPRASRAGALAQRWWGWRPAAASLALAGVAAIAMHLGTLQGADDRLRDEVVASHVRSTLGDHLVDVASSDHHTVKPWLSSRLDFSPPVYELHLPDCQFVGGRLDYLDGRPVAALVYRRGQHVVNAFVWPTPGPDTMAEFSTERGFQTAHWTQGAMTYWVVSDAGRDEFKAIVRAVQTADRDR